VDIRASLIALLTSAGLAACCFAPVGEQPSNGNCQSDAGHSGLSAACAQASKPSFGTLGMYPSTGFLALASGDLNGDGLQDLVATSNPQCPITPCTSWGFDVLFGKPDGTLLTSAHHAESDGEGLAIADLNGDGLLDVVATNGSSLSIFLNTGKGLLGIPAQVALAGIALGVGVGDVNGDGAPDVVAGERSCPVGAACVDLDAELFLNDGTGRFEKPIALQARGGSGGVAVVDLNKDGLADIAIIGNLADNWTVVLSQPDGGFDATTYPLPSGSSNQSYGGGLAVLDTHRDGAPDLALSSWNHVVGGSLLSTFRNRGDGHFDLAGSYAVRQPGGVGWIISGDLNGDCLPDIAASGGLSSEPPGLPAVDTCNLIVLYGNADGGFTEPMQLDCAGGLSGLALLGPTCSPRLIAVANEFSGLSILGPHP
jgi:hypothetical protein